MHSIGLQFHSFHPRLSKNSSQLFPDVQYIHVCLCFFPHRFSINKPRLHILTAELPAGRFYMCFLKYIIYLSSLISVCWLHLLLCMMNFCSTWIQSCRTHCSAWWIIFLERHRVREGWCWETGTVCIGVRVLACGEYDWTAQSEIGSWLTAYSWSMSSGLSRKSGYPVITIMCFSWERTRTKGADDGKTEKVEDKQLVQHHPTSTSSNNHSYTVFWSEAPSKHTCIN